MEAVLVVCSSSGGRARRQAGGRFHIRGGACLTFEVAGGSCRAHSISSRAHRFSSLAGGRTMSLESGRYIMTVDRLVSVRPYLLTYPSTANCC